MITPADNGVYLDIQVQPRARRTGVLGVHDQRLKIAVAAPAEGGKANRAAIGVIADLFHLAARDVILVAGAGARRKRVFLPGVTAENARAAIEESVVG